MTPLLFPQPGEGPQLCSPLVSSLGVLAGEFLMDEISQPFGHFNGPPGFFGRKLDCRIYRIPRLGNISVEGSEIVFKLRKRFIHADAQGEKFRNAVCFFQSPSLSSQISLEVFLHRLLTEIANLRGEGTIGL